MAKGTWVEITERLSLWGKDFHVLRFNKVTNDPAWKGAKVSGIQSDNAAFEKLSTNKYTRDSKYL